MKALHFYLALFVLLACINKTAACPTTDTDKNSCPPDRSQIDESWDGAGLAKARRLRSIFKHCFFEPKNHLKWARNAAKIGTAKDIDELAIILDSYSNSMNDKKSALAQFRIAAQKGYMVSQYTYAKKLLESGKTDEALTWLELAAKNGYIFAAQHLGKIFQNDPMRLSYEKSLAWYALADCMGGSTVDIRLVEPTKDLVEKMSLIQIENAQLIFEDISEPLSQRSGWCKHSGIYPSAE